MRAQSSKSRAFGFCPLKPIVVWVATTLARPSRRPAARLTLSAIGLEPVTRLLLLVMSSLEPRLPASGYPQTVLAMPQNCQGKQPAGPFGARSDGLP